MSHERLEAGGVAERDPLAQILARARHWIEAERFAEAERELARGLALAPDEPWLYFELGRTMVRTARPERALECLAECLRCDPTFAPALVVAGAVRTGRGDYLRAEQELLEALRLEPELPAAYECYGDLMRVTGHSAKARALYERGLALDPESASLHSKIALLENARWGGEHSQGFVRRGLKLAPEDALTHLSMAHHLLNRGRPFAAREHVREALRLEPQNAQIEALWLEVDRCTRWVYVPMFYWSLVVSRLPGQQLAPWIAVMLLAYAGQRLGWSPLVWGPVVVGYGLFCIYSWLAGALVRGWIKLFPPKL